MIKKEEIEQNINSEWQISLEFQKKSRYGLARLINDMCLRNNLNEDISSIAINLCNYFFIKKCLLNYDKLTLACAAILITTKAYNSTIQFTDIATDYIHYYKKIFQESFGNTNNYNSEELIKAKENIGAYEICLLKTLNFEVNIDLPFDFVYIYCDILYPDNKKDMFDISIKVAHDSFYTYANNIYSFYTVALSCIVIAAKILDLPTLLDKNFNNINNLRKINTEDVRNNEKEFHKRLVDYENFNEKNDEKDIDYFNKLSPSEKAHPLVKVDEILECIKMINEFYLDMKKLCIKIESEKIKKKNR
jgi:hypothetical protein